MTNAEKIALLKAFGEALDYVQENCSDDLPNPQAVQALQTAIVGDSSPQTPQYSLKGS